MCEALLGAGSYLVIIPREGGRSAQEGIWVGERGPWTPGEEQALRVVFPSHDSQRE